MARRFPRGGRVLRRGPKAAATTTVAAAAVQDPRRQFLCLAAQQNAQKNARDANGKTPVQCVHPNKNDSTLRKMVVETEAILKKI